MRFLGRSLVVLALAFVGCQQAGPELGQVEGVVTNANGPVANATVEFHPTEGRPSFGTTDEQGRYTLSYSNDLTGATLGEHEIRVSVPGEAPKVPEGATEVPPPATTLMMLQDKVTVTSGDNQIDIDLTRARPM